MAYKKSQQTNVPPTEEIEGTLKRLGLLRDGEDPHSLSEVTEGKELDVDVLSISEAEEERALEQAQQAIQTSASPLRGALFAKKEEELSTPFFTETSAQQELDIPLPSSKKEDDSVFVVPQPRTRLVKQTASPAVKKLGAILAKKLPGAERVKIKKRMDNGQLGIIGEYSMADLANSSDMESFILKWIKPKFGPGVYKITGVDAAGNELEAGEVPVIEPDPSTEQNSALSMVQALIERQDRERKEAEEKMAQQPQINPITMLKELHEVQAAMNPKDENQGTMAAVIASQGQQMQAFMQMMAAQSQQTMQMMMAAMQPKEDPTMKMLLAKLVEEKSSGGQAMALPPPPPPSNPLDGIKDLIVAIAPLVIPLMQKREDPEIRELIRGALQKTSEQALSPRDVIALVQEMQGSKQNGNTFRESMENMSMLLTVAQNLRGSSEGSSSAGFFDALGALFSNRDFGASIAQSIRAASEAKQQQQAMEARKEQLKMLAEIKRQNAQNGGQTAAVVPLPQQRPQVVPQPSAQVQPMRPVPQTATQAIVPPPPTQQTSADKIKLPKIPVATHEHLNGIVSAKDDPATLMQKTVNFFIYLAEFPDWRPLAEMLLGFVQRGEKEKAVGMVHQLFGAFAGMGLIGMDIVQRVSTVFDMAFDHIQNHLADLPIPGDTPNAIEEALEDAEGDDDETDEDDSEEVTDDEEEEQGADAKSA